jgi:hypothetical protein
LNQLVIGNNAYQHIGKLRNAVSDATLMTSTLRSVGFAVETVTNGTRSEMVAALRRLGKRAAGQQTVDRPEKRAFGDVHRLFDGSEYDGSRWFGRQFALYAGVIEGDANAEFGN